MLVELGAVEQRYRAVLEVLEEGVSVTEVARRYGVVRQTVHGWLRRYAEDGLGGLADRSPRPASCPHQMPAPVEARIVAMRREHPGWGPSRIRWELERAGVVPLPGRSAVYRALVRHGPVAARKRRRRREDYRRWERPRAMDLWQMDVMGRVYLAGGAEVKIVTRIDDHSRFVVCAKAVMRASGPNPLVAWLAAEVVALRQPGTRDPGPAPLLPGGDLAVGGDLPAAGGRPGGDDGHRAGQDIPDALARRYRRARRRRDRRVRTVVLLGAAQARAAAPFRSSLNPAAATGSP